MKKYRGLKIAAVLAAVAGMLFGVVGPAQAATTVSTGSIFSTDAGNRTNGSIQWYATNLYYGTWTLYDAKADGNSPRVWIQDYSKLSGGGVVKTNYTACSTGQGTTCTYKNTGTFTDTYAVEVWVCNGGSSTSRLNCTVKTYFNPYK